MTITRFFSSAALAIAISTSAQSQDIGSVKITDSIHMLTGKGGNIGVLIGEDGTFLIDDKFAPMTDAILAKVKSLGGDTPKFVLNTHFHGDHTGGNENLGKAGSVIVSHNNVRTRLSSDSEIKAFNMQLKAQSKDGLPVVTYGHDMSLHLNGETISIMHTPNAHTDGDSLVHFENSNVIHTGDLLFNGFYPFIDPEHGGTVKGMIAGIDKVLALADDKTVVMPGHGPLANKQAVQAYRDMLATALDRLGQLKAQGKTAQQAAASKPLADLDADWADGMFSSERWIEVIWDAI